MRRVTKADIKNGDIFVMTEETTKARYNLISNSAGYINFYLVFRGNEERRDWQKSGWLDNKNSLNDGWTFEIPENDNEILKLKKEIMIARMEI